MTTPDIPEEQSLPEPMTEEEFSEYADLDDEDAYDELEEDPFDEEDPH